MEPLLHFMLCQKCLQEGHLATLGLGGNKKKRPFEKHTEIQGFYYVILSFQLVFL